MSFREEYPMVADGGLSADESLRRMYRLTADHERPFEAKLRELLSLGCAYLGVEAGFLTKISGERQLIVEAAGEHELLQPGASCPLSEAYCRKTIEKEMALTVQHASVEGWERDAAYERFGLESYIGAKVVVDGEVYGTFCFADSEPRSESFTEHEETFVELMAEWVSYELFHKQATEQIQQQRDQLDEFASVVSHDLRNPINVMQGYLTLAEETGDSEHFEQCRKALHRMERLIDDMLTLAREGETVAEMEELDLANLVSECWQSVATNDATLRIETEQSISGDQSRLQQVFENLFRNAIEHGGANVTIEVGELDDCTGFYVSDDGEGIPESDRENVFESGYSTTVDGTGFGLAIVKRIADAHNWTITITDSDIGGARFEFTDLPA